MNYWGKVCCISAGLASISILLILRRKTQKKRSSKITAQQAPGPYGWPLVGHLTYINPCNPYPFLDSCVSKYGPIFKLKLGSWNAIFFTDYHHIKQLYNNAESTFRPKMFLFDLVSLGNHGLLSSEGTLWTEHRRFALKQLKDLGVGKSLIETHIQREVIEITDRLKQSCGTPITLDSALNIAIINIIWAVVAGNRMEYDDPKFLRFVKAVNRNMEVAANLGILTFMPWISRVFPSWLLGTHELYTAIDDFYKYTKDLIREHKDNFDANDPRDYIDHYLLKQSKLGESSSFTDVQLMATIGDFFAAGGETTGTTLRWAVLLITIHPDIQKRLQAEIDDVVGKEKLVSTEDEKRMPYTLAVINEVLRFSDITSTNFLHCNESAIDFNGYFIPQNTLLVACPSHCHRNSKYWQKPYEFYPEHFLSKDGNFLGVNVEGFLPFSIGKRQCIGEKLARAELFIFIVTFFQKFNFRLADEPKPSLLADVRSGMIRWPSPYKIILENRF